MYNPIFNEDNYNRFHSAGRWLNGLSTIKNSVRNNRLRTPLGKFYQHGATLAVITGVGILIGGASVALFFSDCRTFFGSSHTDKGNPSH